MIVVIPKDYLYPTAPLYTCTHVHAFVCHVIIIMTLLSLTDSSMHRFLTSPFDSQDLNLHMSSTISVPSPIQVGRRTPAIGAINENSSGSGLIPPVTQSVVGLPQELLVRQESGLGYSSRSSSDEDSETLDPFASQASSQEDIADAIKGALEELELTSSSVHSSFNEDERLEYGPSSTTMATTYHHGAGTAGSTDGFSDLITVPDSGLLSAKRQQSKADNDFAHQNDHLDQGGNVDQSLNLEELSLRVGRGGKATLNQSNADETLIGDEVEPSLMREADDFSRFNPSHLASLLEKDNLDVSTKSLLSSERIASGSSSSTTTCLKLGSSLLPVTDPMSKVTASTRMSSLKAGTKLSASLPTEGSNIERKDGPSSAAKNHKEGLNLEREGARNGDVSSKSESDLSYAEASSSMLSGRASQAHTMEVQQTIYHPYSSQYYLIRHLDGYVLYSYGLSRHP